MPEKTMTDIEVLMEDTKKRLQVLGKDASDEAVKTLLVDTPGLTDKQRFILYLENLDLDEEETTRLEALVGQAKNWDEFWELFFKWRGTIKRPLPIK